MEDIANRVGVAKSTVSLALNNKAGVSPELRAQILHTAEVVGYRLPSRRHSKGPASKILTIINHVVQKSDSVPSGVSLGFLNGIQAFARQKGTNLTIITDYRGGDIPQLGLEFLRSAPSPEGLILLGPGLTKDSPFLHWAEQRGLPVVVLSRNWADQSWPLSFVSQDHHQQSYLALQYLLDLGHRRIAFVASNLDRDCDWFSCRLECYRKALSAAGIAFDEQLVAVARDGSLAVKELMARRPDVTAVFGIYDRIAIQAMQGLIEIGRNVPQDVSVIGLDNADQPPQGYPSLSTVGFSHFQAGYLAAEVLLRKLENPEVLRERITLQSHLIERESCTRPRL